MLGFLKRNAKKEQERLLAQNYMSAHFLNAFDQAISKMALDQVETIRAVRHPGTLLDPAIASSLLRTNKILRRLYDSTPAKYMKSFDEEFRPVLGWKRYLQDMEDDQEQGT